MIKSIINKYPLASYVTINYLVSWLFLYPCYQIILNNEEGGIPPFAFIGMIGAYGPSLIAVLIEGIQNGKTGIKDLFKKIVIWKVNPIWYVFVFSSPILIYGTAVFLSSYFGFELEDANFKEGISLSVIYILLALPFGPMGEELGWRGFMLPRLLEKYDLWKSSLILGATWTFWHIASFTFPGAAIPSVFDVSTWTIFLYLLNLIAETLLMTFIFFKTRGSVLMAILYHATFNSCSNIVLKIFPLVEDNVAQREIIFIFNFLLMGLVAVILLLFTTHSNKRD